MLDLGELGARRVLIVASARAPRRSLLLAKIGVPDVEVFTGWTPNPTLEQGLCGAEVITRIRPGAVVVLGGGSAIDVAKLSRSLPRRTSAAPDVLAGSREPMAGRVPLVAVPTRAGSGSEVTRFATVYVERVKHSLGHPSGASRGGPSRSRAAGYVSASGPLELRVRRPLPRGRVLLEHPIDPAFPGAGADGRL